MEQKEIKINCPEGFEIDEENSTFECIKFKPIKNKLPKTWEEYCSTHPIREEERWINTASTIEPVQFHNKDRDCFKDKNLLPSKELAEAMLTLCQLIQLRDCYNAGWTPNWKNKAETKYVISPNSDVVITNFVWLGNKILAFKTEELRDQFFRNFRDLIEIAKPLL